MQCPRPISVVYRGHVPCGQCLQCRINKQRCWTTRLLLEACFHEYSSFATLTYSDEHLPRTQAGLPTLLYDDVQLWLKRLREQLSPRTMRYYVVGEYGDKTDRPHYHAILYGICEAELELVQTTWGKGICTLTAFAKQRAAYCAHYVVKKLRGDHPKLADRLQEQSWMSRRPGIGLPAVEIIGEALLASHGRIAMEANGDVPHTVRLEGKEWPLDYYMLTKLRAYCGIGLTQADRGDLVPTNLTPVEIRDNVNRENWLHARQRSRNLGQTTKTS